MAFVFQIMMAQGGGSCCSSCATARKKSRYQKDPAYAKWFNEECARRACVTADEAMARSVREAHEPIQWYDRYEPEAPRAEPSIFSRIRSFFCGPDPYKYTQLENHKDHIQ